MGLKSTLNLTSPLFGLPNRAPFHPTEEIKIKCHPREYPAKPNPSDLSGQRQGKIWLIKVDTAAP